MAGAPSILVFSRYPGTGLILVTGLFLLEILVGYVRDHLVRAAITTVIGIVLGAITIGPFVILFWMAIRGARIQISGTYVTYVFFALQLGFSGIILAIAQWDPGAYRRLCDPPFCDSTDPWQLGLRVFYFSAVSFVSVGYGDIVPLSLVATGFTLPMLWVPGIYVAVSLSVLRLGPYQERGRR